MGYSTSDRVRRRFAKRLGVAAITAALTSVLSVGVGAAQDHSVHIEGRVLWIEEETMVVVPYSNSGPIRIDLRQVHQEEYRGLVTDDAVVVTGTVSNEGDRVIATSIQTLGS
jgi:hypothetical protein